MRATRDLPLALSLALLAATFFFGGGQGIGSLPWVGGAALAAGVALVATRGVPARTWTLVPLLLLALWCAFSIGWSVQPDRSWEYVNRALVALALAVLGLTVAPRTRALALGLCALLGAVCLWALAGKVVPALTPDGYERIARLRYPVGIWNQLALLGDYALPLALWLALRRRVLGALLAYGWLVALVLTFSRGGLIVALVVLVAWVALSRLWLEAGATLLAAGIPAAVVVGVAFALSGITSDLQPHATRVRDGWIFGLALLLGAGAAVLLARLPLPAATPRLRRTALAAAAVVGAAALVLGGLHARSAYRSFTSTTVSQVENGKGRLGIADSNNRYVWWKQAWSAWREKPVAGTGAGSFHVANLRLRQTYLDETIEPHDLPLQFLSETGIVGLALLALACAVLLRAAGRRRDHELALTLVLPAFLLHALLDIDWDFLAVAAPAFLVAGALAGRPADESRRPAPFAALAAAGAAVAIFGSLLLPWLGARWSGQAEAALERPARAVELARRARSANPLAVDPLTNEALAEEIRGNPGRAYALFAEATRVQPQSAQVWLALGRFELVVQGCPRRALPHLEHYTALDPQARTEQGARDKDRALALVNSGKPTC